MPDKPGRLNPPPMEIFVVADGDTGGSRQKAEEFTPGH